MPNLPALARHVVLTAGLKGGLIDSAEHEFIDFALITMYRDVAADHQTAAGLRSDATWTAPVDGQTGASAKCCMSKLMAAGCTHEAILDGLSISARIGGLMDFAFGCSRRLRC